MTPPPPPARAAFGPKQLIDLLFVFLCAILFLSYFRHLDSYDSDALGIAGNFRLTGGHFTGIVNANAYTYIAALMAGVNALVNLSGFAWNDYLLAYRLVLYLASIGLMGLTYAALLMLTRRRFLAFAFGLSLAFLPGIVDLSVIAEDNIFSSAMHMQYLLVFLATTIALSRGSRVSRRRRRALVCLLPLSLLLALTSHRAHNVLWITPLALPWLAGRRYDRALCRRIAVIYAATLAGFALVVLVLILSAGWEVTGHIYWGMIHDWLFPNAAYRHYYFFNRYDWNLFAQCGRIMEGAGRLLSREPFAGGPLCWFYVGLFFFPLLPFLLRRARPRRIWCVPLLFALIHIPHSLIYESENVERWDIIVPPLIVLAGVLALHLHNCVRLNLAGRRRSAGWLLAPFLLAIAIHNVADRRELLRQLDLEASWPRRGELAAVLRARAAPAARQWEGPVLLVINKEEYDPNRMLPAAYFSLTGEIFVLREDGGIDQPDQLFQISDDFRHPTREAFLARAANARVMGTQSALQRLEALKNTQRPHPPPD